MRTTAEERDYCKRAWEFFTVRHPRFVLDVLDDFSDLEAENADLKESQDSLRARLDYIGDITGIAGVDSPMTIEECVLELKARLAEAEFIMEGCFCIYKGFTALGQYLEKYALLAPSGLDGQSVTPNAER